MKLWLVLLASGSLFAADWDAVRYLPPGKKIEIATMAGGRTRATFASATGESLVMIEKSGERSLNRAEIKQVRVYDPYRRLRKGLMWTGIGAGGGAAAGAGACPSCPNEGHGYKYVGLGVAVGAGIGTLGFLASPYRTVYKNK